MDFVEDRHDFIGKIARDEYELMFYSFTVDQFKSESKKFLEHVIKTRLQKKVERSLAILKAANIATDKHVEKISSASKLCEKKILNRIGGKIGCLEKTIDSKFRIPDTIDVVNEKPAPDLDVDELKKELQLLEHSIKQTAYFLNVLNQEFNNYQQLEDIINTEKDLNDMVSRNLNIVVNTEIMENLSKKLKEL